MTKKLPNEKRQQDILNAAVYEFVEKGYENATMEGIAKRAGLTKGGLYHHFNSKDEILIAANDLFMKPIEEFMKEAEKCTSAAQGLCLFIEKYINYWTDHKTEMIFIFLSLTKTLEDKNMWKIYEMYTQSMLAFYNSLYSRSIASGEMREHNCDERSIALLGALDGIIGYLVMDEKLSSEKTINSFKNLFVKELLI